MRQPLTVASPPKQLLKGGPKKTEKYKEILKYLEQGYIKTPENITFVEDNVKYDVNFELSLSYDRSNGIYDKEFNLLNGTIKHPKQPIETINFLQNLPEIYELKKYIKHMIREIYIYKNYPYSLVKRI